MDAVLQATLTTLLTQLANFFGTTTEVIMQNAPYWLAQYGWYTMMMNIPFAIFIALIFTTITAGALYGLAEIKDNHMFRHILIIFVAFAIVFCAICVGQCAIAPEMYGLNALMRLIK